MQSASLVSASGDVLQRLHIPNFDVQVRVLFHFRGSFLIVPLTHEYCVKSGREVTRKFIAGYAHYVLVPVYDAVGDVI
jgi:hypothetical protein